MKTPNIETVKTIVITILLTGILAFIAGIKYQNHVNSQVKAEAKSIVSLKP